MASPAKKKKVDIKSDPLPACPYGSRCYRKNPQHLAEFSHPAKDEKASDASDATDGPSPSSLPATDSSSSLPPCKYGASCYRKNLMHFAEYSHPTATKQAASESGSDTDELEEEDDKKSSVKSEDILKRGMSLVKTYSKMTEDERKELIKKAFEAKQKLQKELEKTKEEVKKKDKELDKLQKEVATGLLLMEGEKEALEGTKTVYFDLHAERAYKEGSADQTHFRLAESQFYRLLTGNAQYRISKVEYVVNPKLVKLFKGCRESLAKVRGEDFSYPVLGFHGTMEKNIKPICEGGFRVPGDKGHGHRTDTGWYGKGVYFSEYPAYSIGYIQGSTKLLLCQVLPGKVYQCTKLIHGAALQKGHDSHTSPDKKELVIFNAYHILPSYIVHYTNVKGEFKYAKGASMMPGTKKAGKDEMVGFERLEDAAMKCVEAQGKPKSKIFVGESVTVSGVFSCTQRELLELVTNHGGKAGTKAVFTFLVASEPEFEAQTAKVTTALKKDLPVVVETYIYDCIIAGKKLDMPKYQVD